MFNAKLKGVYETNAGTRVRVTNIKEDRFDPKYSVVTIADVNGRNRTVKGTERTIYQDSLRRRYVAA